MELMVTDQPPNAIGVALVLLLVYITPWSIARRRNHKNAQVIGILNLLLGWTVIGWIIALVWAYTQTPFSDDYSDCV